MLKSLEMEILRLRSGLSQQELADKVGVTKVMISRYEAGSADPRLETLRLIATTLGATIDELVK